LLAHLFGVLLLLTMPTASSRMFVATKVSEAISAQGRRDFSGRSDYGPFIAVGIPSGGLFTGAAGHGCCCASAWSFKLASQ
jgi:hypothetical protein